MKKLAKTYALSKIIYGAGIYYPLLAETTKNKIEVSIGPIKV